MGVSPVRSTTLKIYFLHALFNYPIIFCWATLWSSKYICFMLYHIIGVYLPSLETRMFWGFKSLWTILWLWRKSTPDRIWEVFYCQEESFPLFYNSIRELMTLMTMTTMTMMMMKTCHMMSFILSGARPGGGHRSM